MPVLMFIKEKFTGLRKMAEIAAGQAVIELLRAEGVEYVFGVTGLTTNSMAVSYTHLTLPTILLV